MGDSPFSDISARASAVNLPCRVPLSLCFQDEVICVFINIKLQIMAKTKKEVAPPAEPSNPLGGKPKTKKYLSQQKDAIPKKLTTLEMIVEAVDSNSDRKGASLPFIKKYIVDTYGGESASHSLKKAFVKGIQDEVLIRPKSTEDSNGMLGRFKVNKDRVKNGKIMKKPKKAKKKIAEPESDEESTSKTKTKKDTAATKGKKGKSTEISEGAKASKTKKVDTKSKKAVTEDAKETKKATPSKTTKKEDTKAKATKEKTETKTNKTKAKDNPPAKAPKETAKDKKSSKKVNIKDDKEVVKKQEPKAKKGGGRSKNNSQSDSEVYEDDIEDRQHAKET